MERTFDFISLAILAAGVSYFINVPEFVGVGLLVISFGSMGVLAVLFLAAKSPWTADLILRSFRGFLPGPMQEKSEQSFRQALSGLASLKSFRAVGSIFVLSLVCWGLIYVSYLFTLKAYNLSFAWSLPLFLLVLLNFGMLLPATPGSLGIYQFFSILALDFFGVEKSVALGFSFVLQAVDILPSTLLGMWYFCGVRSSSGQPSGR